VLRRDHKNLIFCPIRYEMSVRKFEVYIRADYFTIVYLGSHLQLGESITVVKIEGMIEECEYAFYFDTYSDVTDRTQYSRKYQCNGSTRIIINKKCKCEFNEIMHIIAYCVTNHVETVGAKF
jgi:hypothetical protein